MATNWDIEITSQLECHPSFLRMNIYWMCSLMYYLVLVRGVKFIPWFRVTGLVPAKHKKKRIGNLPYTQMFLIFAPLRMIRRWLFLLNVSCKTHGAETAQQKNKIKIDLNRTWGAHFRTNVQMFASDTAENCFTSFVLWYIVLNLKDKR